MIPLAPFNEQKRIVAKLEKLLAKIEICQKRLAKIPVLFKHFRQSVLAAACSGRLTADWRKKNPQSSLPDSLKRASQDDMELPNAWASVSVGDVITNLKYGTAKKCEHGGKGVPVLRIPNIGEGVVDHSDLKYANLEKKELESLRLSMGDILLIRSNGSVSLVGKTAIVRKSETGFAYAGYLIRIRPDQKLICPEYLNFALASFDVRLQIEVPARSTSGVNNINSDEVKKLRIAIGSLPEQDEIVRRVEKLFKLAETIEARYAKAKTFVDKLTQSILAKAFRGELVSQDPSDESAERLLERIIKPDREKKESRIGKKSVRIEVK